MNGTTNPEQGASAGRVAVRAAIVALTLATAWIHYSLGGELFLMNAAGYASLAAGMVLPGPARRFRGLIRLALLGFTVTTIVGWILIGARFDLAYLDKGIETALVALLLVEMRLRDQGPIALARRALAGARA